MMFVTLPETKLRLRFDTDFEDPDLLEMIGEASESVWNYIKDGVDGLWLDSAGLPIEDTAGFVANVPRAIRSATFLMIGILSRDRDGEDAKEWDHGFLPTPVLSILYPYRLPSLA